MALDGLSERLQEAFAKLKGKGKISIPFNNEADLERIMEILDSLKPKE